MDKKYRLAIVAIVKNEAKYIAEWLEFHSRQGVEHFYIYDNESSDRLTNVIKTYINNGTVTLLNAPGDLMQMPSYNHALNTFGNECKYMAFIDADEFLFATQPGNIADVCDEIITSYNKTEFKVSGVQPAAIAVNWRIYGTSGHQEPTDTILDNYVHRAPDRLPENCHIKSICIPENCIQFNQPHNPQTKEGALEISEYGTYIFTPYFYDGNCEKLRINHYSSKSFSEFLFKNTKRGWPDTNDRKVDLENRMLVAQTTWNEVYDPIIKNR